MQQSGQQSLVFRKNQIDATGHSNRTRRVIRESVAFWMGGGEFLVAGSILEVVCDLIVRLRDKSGVERNVIEGVVDGDECIFVTGYERQKRIRIRDVRLGLNPTELLPEKTNEARHFGVMQGETGTKVHERADLPRRYRSFKHIAVPQLSKVEGGIKDVPLIVARAPIRQSFSPAILRRFDLGTVSNLISTSPATAFLSIRESHRAAIQRGNGNIFADDGLRTPSKQGVEFVLCNGQPSIRTVGPCSRCSMEIRHGVSLYPCPPCRS